ncbi:hypothetical protein [Parapedobacter soli]|uniref:hypothetical protein n=1 Tax=Parapedobacter soli TaxID=416955 RepID=UPI0021C5A179|nr:hypothetical protein [Parapedobacter soli]
MATSEEINRRFFTALDKLIKAREIKSARQFCSKNGYLPTNLSRLRSEPGRELPTRLLSALVSDHNISGDWLLVGTGSMKKPKHVRNN